MASESERLSHPAEPASERGVLWAACEHVNQITETVCDECGSELYMTCSECGQRNERIWSRCCKCRRELHRSWWSRQLKRWLELGFWLALATI